MRRFSDEDVDKAAHLLSKGGKMLAKHCPECKAPLFEVQGQIVCPICSEKKPEEEDEVEPQTDSERPEEPESEQPQESDIGEKPQTTTSTGIRGPVEGILARLVEDAEGETDLHRLKTQLECIEQALDILEKI